MVLSISDIFFRGKFISIIGGRLQYFCFSDFRDDFLDYDYEETSVDKDYNSEYLYKEKTTSTTENYILDDTANEYNDVEIRVGTHIEESNITSTINGTAMKNSSTDIVRETTDFTFEKKQTEMTKEMQVSTETQFTAGDESVTASYPLLTEDVAVSVLEFDTNKTQFLLENETSTDPFGNSSHANTDYDTDYQAPSEESKFAILLKNTSINESEILNKKVELRDFSSNNNITDVITENSNNVSDGQEKTPDNRGFLESQVSTEPVRYTTNPPVDEDTYEDADLNIVTNIEIKEDFGMSIDPHPRMLITSKNDTFYDMSYFQLGVETTTVSQDFTYLEDQSTLSSLYNESKRDMESISHNDSFDIHDSKLDSQWQLNVSEILSVESFTESTTNEYYSTDNHTPSIENVSGNIESNTVSGPEVVTFMVDDESFFEGNDPSLVIEYGDGHEETDIQHDPSMATEGSVTEKYMDISTYNIQHYIHDPSITTEDSVTKKYMDFSTQTTELEFTETTKFVYDDTTANQATSTETPSLAENMIDKNCTSVRSKQRKLSISAETTTETNIIIESILSDVVPETTTIPDYFKDTGDLIFGDYITTIDPPLVSTNSEIGDETEQSNLEPLTSDLQQLFDLTKSILLSKLYPINSSTSVPGVTKEVTTSPYLGIDYYTTEHLDTTVEATDEYFVENEPTELPNLKSTQNNFPTTELPKLPENIFPNHSVKEDGHKISVQDETTTTNSTTIRYLKEFLFLPVQNLQANFRIQDDVADATAEVDSNVLESDAANKTYNSSQTYLNNTHFSNITTDVYKKSNYSLFKEEDFPSQTTTQEVYVEKSYDKDTTDYEDQNIIFDDVLSPRKNKGGGKEVNSRGLIEAKMDIDTRDRHQPGIKPPK